MAEDDRCRLIVDAVERARVLSDGRTFGEQWLFHPSTLQDKPIPPRRFAVPGWIPDRVVTVLSGDGGLGKSLAALQCSTCLALGLPFLGIDLAPRKVLYFSAEDDLEEMHRRQADINRALGIDFADLDGRMYWKCLSGDDALLAAMDEKTKRLTSRPAYENLRRTCKEEGIQLVVIDTVADTFGGLEIDRQQVTRYVRLAEAIARDNDGAVILVAHPSAAGLREGTGISGSTAWRNAARSVLYLRRPDTEPGEPEDRDARILERVKGNYAPSGGTIRMRWHDGHFILDGEPVLGGGPLDHVFMEHAILRAVEGLLRNGQHPSPSRNSPTDYAPKLIKTRPETKDFTISQIERAIKIMTGKEVLREAIVGSGNGRRKVIVPQQWPPLPDERDPATGAKKGA